MGVESTQQVVEHYRWTEFMIETARGRWRWTAEIPLRRALDHLSRRAYSFTQSTPQSIHRIVMERLRAKAETVMVQSVKVPNEIYLVIVQPSSRPAQSATAVG
jgi:hypothetical protein